MVSGSTGEETSDACPAWSRASGFGDVVSLWTTGPPYQGTDAAGTVARGVTATITEALF